MGTKWSEIISENAMTDINDVRLIELAQENPAGTKDNPIVYTEGVPLINNAYYLKDGKIYVWMGEWVVWE